MRTTTGRTWRCSTLNVKLPVRITSLWRTGCAVRPIRTPFRMVPLELPRSRTTQTPSSSITSACIRLTDMSSRAISNSGNRPIRRWHDEDQLRGTGPSPTSDRTILGVWVDDIWCSPWVAGRDRVRAQPEECDVRQNRSTQTAIGVTRPCAANRSAESLSIFRARCGPHTMHRQSAGDFRYSDKGNSVALGLGHGRSGSSGSRVRGHHSHH